LLKSPKVAKMLQDAYHRLNSKARKYEALAPEERLKWEAYYAADQEELSHLLPSLQVIDTGSSFRSVSRWPDEKDWGWHDRED
jgi:hypothetical protein